MRAMQPIHNGLKWNRHGIIDLARMRSQKKWKPRLHQNLTPRMSHFPALLHTNCQNRLVTSRQPGLLLVPMNVSNSTKFAWPVLAIAGLCSCSVHAEQRTATTGSAPLTQRANANRSPVKKCTQTRSLASYMGTYQLVSVKKYAGGLTSQQQANKYIGHTMIVLSAAEATVKGNKTIEDPEYNFVCQAIPKEGDVVPRSDWNSYFYGFGVHRKVVRTLEVRALSSSTKGPYYKFELVSKKGKTEIWYMSDGWLYQLRKAKQP